MATNATALQTAAANKAAVAKPGKPVTLRDMVQDMLPAVKAALPAVMTPERFTRIATSALSANPKLAATTPASFLGAMMTAAQLGLEPNTPLGQAYLIPFKNKGVDETQFQLGYRGLIQLAYRSGEVTSIQAEVVYENDKFDYELGLDPTLKHVPAKSGRGKPTHYYAVWKSKSGAVGFAVMSVEDILEHAKKFSKAYGSGPWQTNFDEMAKKTVLKKALKYAPLASDFVRGIASDESIRDFAEGTDILDTNGKTIDVEPEDATPAAESVPSQQAPAPATAGKTVEEVL